MALKVMGSLCVLPVGSIQVLFFLQQVFFIFAYPFPNVAALMGNEDAKMDEWSHQAGQN